MQQELKDKLNAIIDKHNFVSADGAVKSHRSFILGALEEAYNLAMAENAEKIKAQQKLIESYENRFINDNPRLGQAYIDNIAKNYQGGN